MTVEANTLAVVNAASDSPWMAATTSPSTRAWISSTPQRHSASAAMRYARSSSPTGTLRRARSRAKATACGGGSTSASDRRPPTTSRTMPRLAAVLARAEASSSGSLRRTSSSARSASTVMSVSASQPRSRPPSTSARCQLSATRQRLIARAQHSVSHRGQPLLDEPVGLADDALDQLGDRRHVVDEALDLPGAPDAEVGVALLVDAPAPRAGHQLAHRGEVAALALDGEHLRADGVACHARGVAHGAEDEVGVALGVGDDLRLDVLMDRRLGRAQEACAHVDRV